MRMAMCYSRDGCKKCDSEKTTDVLAWGILLFIRINSAKRILFYFT